LKERFKNILFTSFVENFKVFSVSFPFSFSRKVGNEDASLFLFWNRDAYMIRPRWNTGFIQPCTVPSLPPDG